MRTTDPNDPLWQLRALAQKVPGGEEFDKLLVLLQVERAKVRAILDGLHMASTEDMTLIDLADSTAAQFTELERERDDLLDWRDACADGHVAAEGYHAFATNCDWKYPDGEPMPIWAHLPHEVQDAFVAFTRAVTAPLTRKETP